MDRSLNTELTVVPHSETSSRELTAFSNISAFETAQRMTKALASSKLVPSAYQNDMSNCLVALEMAQRTGASVMAVMQNLHIINGRPSWSASYIIAAVNSCGRFTPLRFSVEKRGKKKINNVEFEDVECFAWANDRTGERLEGPPTSIEMAVREGWFTKQGSKWQTMPELMLRYRAAAFFGRLYAPDILMGMQSDDEVIDVTPTSNDKVEDNTTVQSAKRKIGVKVKARAESATKTDEKSQATEASELSEAGDKPADGGEEFF